MGDYLQPYYDLLIDDQIVILVYPEDRERIGKLFGVEVTDFYLRANYDGKIGSYSTLGAHH